MSFLLAFSLLFVSSILGGAAPSESLKLAGTIDTSQADIIDSPRIAPAEDWLCFLQDHAGNPYYYFNMPQSDADIFAVRFTTCDNQPESLKTINFKVFDPHDGSFGDDGIYVYLYNSDGTFPTSVINTWYLPPGSYQAHPAITSIDLSVLGYVMTGDFHIGIEVNTLTSTGYESFLCDEGTTFTGRSSFYGQGNWQLFDCNFVITALLCHYCPESKGLASECTPRRPMAGSFRTDVSGPPPSQLEWRNITVNKVFFRRIGDLWPPGDVWASGTVGPLFPGPARGIVLRDSQSPYRIWDASRKCADAPCSEYTDECSWEDIGEVIYSEDPIIDPPGDIQIDMKWEDGDQSPWPYVEATYVALFAPFVCVATWVLDNLFNPKQPSNTCAEWTSMVGELYDSACNLPHNKNIDSIGTSHTILTWPPPSDCVQHSMWTPSEKEARVEYVWDYGPRKKGTGMGLQGNRWLDSSRITIDQIRQYFIGHINSAEVKCVADVGPARLDDSTLSTSLREPAPPLYTPPWTREFQFMFDMDNEPGTGDPAAPRCGADYYVSVLQSSDGMNIVVDTNIYCWTTSCCSPDEPTWVLDTIAKPYHLYIDNFRLQIIAPLNALGNPSIWYSWSSWALLLKNNQVISTAPDSVCTERIQITTGPDEVCPIVMSSGYRPEDRRYCFTFSEPMLPPVPSSVQLTPPVPCSLSTDVTGRKLYVTGVPNFAPGYYQVELLAGAAQDAAGNPLKGKCGGNCGDPYNSDFCVGDNGFYTTDQAGNAKPDFEETDEIYVTGHGFPPGAQFYLYLVHDGDVWRQGTKLVDESDDGRTLVTATDGFLNAVGIGRAVHVGEFGVVADIDGNCALGPADRVAGRCPDAVFVGNPCDDGIDGILAWLPLDEQSNAGGWHAEVMEGLHGIDYGNPSPTGGVVKGAARLDGNNDYIQVPHDDLLNFGPSDGDGGGDFTIDCWIRTLDTTGWQVIGEKMTNCLGYSLVVHNGNLEFEMGDGSHCGNYPTTTAVANGLWTHVAVTVDRDSSLQLYVNGAQVYSSNPSLISGSLGNSSPLCLGTHSTPGSHLFKGDVDEFTLYNRALAPGEVYFICQNGTAGKCIGDSTQTYYATGDIDSDGIPLTMSDLTYLMNFIFEGGPRPIFIWQADLNGNCVVDTVDVNMLQCYFVYGLTCIPGYPVQTCYNPIAEPILFLCGDVNANGIVNIADVVYLISYIFSGGPAPNPLESGDVNMNGSVNIADVVYLINYIFNSGPAPCASGRDDAEGKILNDLAPEEATLTLSKSAAAGNSQSDLEVSVNTNAEIAGVQLEFKVDQAKAGEINAATTARSEGLQTYSGIVDGLFKVGLVDLNGNNVIEAGEGPILLLTSQNAEVEFELVNTVLSDRSGREFEVTKEQSTPRATLPTQYSLEQNNPNPFNPSTEISFALPHAAQVQLAIYNIIGQQVTTLVDELLPAGWHSAIWDGTNTAGKSVSSGVYLYRLKTPDFAATRKMLLLK